MNTAAVEDKRAVAVREAKIRDLQAKITALQTIENVRDLRRDSMDAHQGRNGMSLESAYEMWFS